MSRHSCSTLLLFFLFTLLTFSVKAQPIEYARLQSAEAPETTEEILPSEGPSTEDSLLLSGPAKAPSLATPETTEEALVTSSPDEDVTSSPLVDEVDPSMSADPVDPSTSGQIFADECLSDAECNGDEYCSSSNADSRDCILSSCDISPRKCVPRLAIGASCRNTGQCTEGSFCINGPNVVDMVCTKRIEIGGECILSGENGCVEGAECTGGPVSPLDGSGNGTCTKKLEQKQTQEVGEQCSDIQKCVDGGFCDTSTSSGPVNITTGPVGTCKATSPPGGTCDQTTSDIECENGFCLADFDNPNQIKTTCVAYPGIGGPCRFDTNCAPFPVTGFNDREPRIVCNKKNSTTLAGVCLNETSLVKNLGASCDLALNDCDARRGLVCEEFEGKPVCVQRGDVDDVGGVGEGEFPCTPGSPLSTCSGAMIPGPKGSLPKTCRRAISQNGKTPYGTTRCLTALQEASLGQICNHDADTICEDGLACEIGPGISKREPGRRDIVSPVRYCMKSVGIGGDCSEKFETTCEEGSACVNDVCTASATPVEVPETFAGFLDDCSSTPCAPGLTCQEEFGTKSCKKPVETVGAGEDCSSTVATEKVSHIIYT